MLIRESLRGIFAANTQVYFIPFLVLCLVFFGVVSTSLAKDFAEPVLSACLVFRAEGDSHIHDMQTSKTTVQAGR